MLSRRSMLFSGSALLIASSAYLWTSRSASGSDGIWYAGTDGFAADGADVVAYHTLQADAAGRSGTSAHVAEWAGAKWRFVSAENKAIFLQNPQKYAPQYGGYCAWAMARGYKAHGDVDAWMIVGGRLYLNYDENIRRRWQKDIPGFIADADQQWPTVRGTG
ncbi:MAG: YHS domain-containing (seleno)protein [Pseudomonadota bacterium]